MGYTPNYNSCKQYKKYIISFITTKDFPPLSFFLMYADDFLPDDAIFEMDDMDVSIEETSSMDTEERDRKKHIELYKRTDPDYYSYKKVLYNEDGDLKLHKIQLYSSPSVGYIRNAPTGIREQHRVGSKYEELYFRVKDVALDTKTESNKEPRKLFYRNPEEFERHQGIQLSKQIKNEWHERFLNSRSKL